MVILYLKTNLLDLILFRLIISSPLNLLHFLKPLILIFTQTLSDNKECVEYYQIAFLNKYIVI